MKKITEDTKMESMEPEAGQAEGRETENVISYRKLRTLLRSRKMTYSMLKKNKIVHSVAVDVLRKGSGNLRTDTIGALCRFLDCQPGDIMSYEKPSPSAGEMGEIEEMDNDEPGFIFFYLEVETGETTLEQARALTSLIFGALKGLECEFAGSICKEDRSQICFRTPADADKNRILAEVWNLLYPVHLSFVPHWDKSNSDLFIPIDRDQNYECEIWMRYQRPEKIDPMWEENTDSHPPYAFEIMSEIGLTGAPYDSIILDGPEPGNDGMIVKGMRKTLTGSQFLSVTKDAVQCAGTCDDVDAYGLRMDLIREKQKAKLYIDIPPRQEGDTTD